MRMSLNRLAIRFLPALMRTVLWVAALAATLPSPAQTPSQNRTIVAIEFEGLAGSSQEQLLGRIGSRVGDPYSAAAIREDLRRLDPVVRTARVEANDLPEGGVRVRFIIEEYPRLRELAILGNERLPTDRIQSLLGLEPGAVLEDRLLDRLRGSLLNEYQMLGLPEAQVRLHVLDVETDPAAAGEAGPRADLQVAINEGRQVRVEDVIIEGNESFSGLRLRQRMETRGSWGPLRNYYSDTVFMDDLLRLRDFYAGQGYLDARVERGLFEERESGGKAVVSPVVLITEGQRYRFGPVQLSGVTMFAAEDARAPFAAIEGEYFTARRFSQAMNSLRELYFNHGLLTTRFTPRFEPDSAQARLAIEIEVTEGERIYVNRIRLARPEFPELEEEPGWFERWYEQFRPEVRDEVILREILLEPGDVYDRSLERDSLRRLARLNVFKPEELRIESEPSGQSGLHDMVVEVEEAVTGDLVGGVGYGDVTGLFVFGRFEERNVGGRADVLRLSAMLGTRDSRASISYLDRHFGESLDSMLYEVFFQTLRRTGYDARTGGVNVEWSRPLDHNWRLFLLGRLEYVDLRERRGIDAAEDLDQNYGVATARLRLVEDVRGPVGRPYTEGHLQAFGIEAGYAGAALVRLEAERDQYFPIHERLTYRLTASAAAMPFDRDRVPIHERYFLGGSHDLRGFRYRGAGYFDADERRVPIGGAARLLVRNELIFPIADPIRGVIFADAGMLGETPWSWQSPRVSAGTGLRFDLQQVQVAVDLAAPLVRRGRDRTQFFHFSLQSQF